MAILFNQEKNVKINIKLKEGYMLDLEKGRDDFENYIPFKLSLKTPLKKVTINNEVPTFTLYELKNLIAQCRLIIESKRDEDKYVYFNSEAFFNFQIEYLEEDDLVEFEFWINVAYIRNKKAFGFDDGVRFCSEPNQVVMFLDALEDEMNNILIKYNL